MYKPHTRVAPVTYSTMLLLYIYADVCQCLHTSSSVESSSIYYWGVYDFLNPVFAVPDSNFWRALSTFALFQLNFLIPCYHHIYVLYAISEAVATAYVAECLSLIQITEGYIATYPRYI